MRGLYYARVNQDKTSSLGVIQKIRGQVRALEALGAGMDSIWLGNRGVWRNGVIRLPIPLRPPLWSYLFYALVLDWLLARRIDFRHFDFIYIRYPLATPGFLYLLRRAKRQQAQLRIILEFPTFPYDRELSEKGLFYQAALWLDRRCRAKLAPLADYAVHFGPEMQLLNIPCINLSNGIDISQFPPARRTPSGGTLRLIAVASWNTWHGLDRLIRGMAAYHPVRDKGPLVHLTVVGEGPELPRLQELASSLGLEGQVQFAGARSGPELDTYFDQADIGIGTLAIFRKGIQADCSLKHREYCARGIPFILSSEDPDFPAALPFVHRVAPEEAPVAIPEIIRFFTTLTANHADYPERMRRYACDHLGWEKRMEAVLQAINA